jgi:prepilin-type N-terminal cleavage/methylation domain-containing protein
MKFLAKSQQGFSLVETLVVIALVVFVAALMVIGFRNFASFQQYNQALESVEFILEESRLSAKSAVGDSSHGVKFTNTSITRFVGDTYSAGDPQNITTTFNLVTLSYSFSGGVDEVVFAKLTGLPSATGTVTVEGSQFSASTSVTVSKTGVIQ